MEYGSVEGIVEKSMTDEPKSGEDRNGPGGQVSNVIRHPAADSGLGEMRRRVEERKKAEQEKYGRDDGSSGDDEISSEFIRACLWTNQLGDGELFKKLHRNDFVFCKAMKTWLVWAGHHWEIDYMNKAEAAVEDVALVYEKEAWKTKKHMAEADKETLQGPG